MKKEKVNVLIITLFVLFFTSCSSKTDENLNNKKNSIDDSLKVDQYLKDLKNLPELDEFFKNHWDEIDKNKIFYIDGLAYYRNLNNTVMIVDSISYAKISLSLPIEFLAVFDFVQTVLWGPEFVKTYTIKKIIKPKDKLNFLENSDIIIEFDEDLIIEKSDSLLKKYKCTKNDFICKGQLVYKFDYFLDRGADHHYRGFFLYSDKRYEWQVR